MSIHEVYDWLFTPVDSGVSETSICLLRPMVRLRDLREADAM